MRELTDTEQIAPFTVGKTVRAVHEIIGAEFTADEWSFRIEYTDGTALEVHYQDGSIAWFASEAGEAPSTRRQDVVTRLAWVAIALCLLSVALLALWR